MAKPTPEEEQAAIDAWVKRTVGAAPPLTIEQRKRLMPMLRDAYERVLADRAAEPEGHTRGTADSGDRETLA